MRIVLHVQELNDKKRSATTNANFARAYTVEFGTCKFPENFTGCQDLAKQKVFIITSLIAFFHILLLTIYLLYMFWEYRKCLSSAMTWRLNARAKTSSNVDPMSSGNGQNRNVIMHATSSLAQLLLSCRNIYNVTFIYYNFVKSLN